MRIRRLDITGFKSFMDRAVFTFGDGITGVVGPNGCGKSNVVDAIRWVMGEQSAKNLRGRGMEDVIFNGSESKPPLSMAEVTLTFQVEPTDQLAPQYAGLEEISITRRLFRSGESEYLINKTACRLLDITELFLGTGVGTRAYSIIEQGRVGLIVSAKPEDRRAFIEEAAGITRYKARRKAAERKMEYTQQNLLRVTDIVNELEKRLDSLNRQARKAEKYRKLKAEARQIELHEASHRYLELFAEQKVLKERLESLSSEEQQALERVRALEETVSSRREALDAESLQLEALAERVHALEGQLKLDEQNLSHWNADQNDTRRHLAQAKSESDELSARRAELLGSLEAKEREIESLQVAWKEDEVAMQVAQEELRRVTELKAEVEKRLDQERSQLVDIAGRLANHESNLANLGRRKGELESRMAKNRAEAEVLREEEKALERGRDDLSGRIEEIRQRARELLARKGEEEAALSRTREAFAENEIQVICLREELADKRSRLTSLQEIQRNYEGYDRGVRAVMMKAGFGEGGSGVYGLVADLISAPPEYEKAIEAALGERLQHVVVDRPERAFELVESLKALSEGRSSFLPLTAVGAVDGGGPHPVVEPVAAEQPASAEQASAVASARPALPAGVLARAVDEARCDERFRPLIQSLLADVLIVQDLAAARALSAELGERKTLVTLDGEVIGADGSITGGVLEGPAVGALQKKREIAELSEEVARVEERYNEIVTRHYALQKQMGHTEGVLKGLARHQHQDELSLAAAEKDLHKASEDLARLRDRLANLDREREHLEAEMQALLLEEESSRTELFCGQTDRESREERVRQMMGEAESLAHRSAQLSSQLMGLRAKVAAGAEKLEGQRRELERLRAQAEEIAGRLERLAQSMAEGEQRLAELASRIAETAVGRDEKAERLGAWKAELESRREAHAKAGAEVKEQEGALRELRGKLDELTQGLSHLSLRERELHLELEHLVAQVSERYQTNLLHELHEYHWRPRITAENEQRLKELKQQLERMGEINLTAIEEHAELQKRYDFLTAQKKDLESSLEQLKAAIVKIDRTSRERFEQTFEIVNQKFQHVFPRLFGGGRAGLVLTQEGVGQEPGVEIIAQPPGKKLQSVSLLSGGEKALTAVALIFAIFLIKPTPFCLLDEVDAPLDEANVGRYNDLVREMARQSQFILITHNKRTMEIVDALYGITMEEPGISKVVSVKMREAVAANEDQVA